jgi:hypothetical protein
MQAMVEYRGKFEIWINGVPAATSGEETSGGRDIDISDEAMRTLHAGPNVIAITARRIANKPGDDQEEGPGDQYIDAGLRVFRKPDLGPERSDDPDRAAWVMVAHVLLNLDETLTKR